MSDRRSKAPPAPEATAARRIVAIVGTAPSSCMQVNEQPPEVEVWMLNDCWTFLQRPWHRWFEIHGLDILRKEGKPHDQFLQTGVSPVQELCVPAEGAEIMMLEHHDEFPLSVKYPLEEIKRVFGSMNNADGNPYLMSTIDWMIALAILEQVDEIRIYGVNHATSTEFAHQRPSCEFWLGMAVAKGINVTVPDNSPLLQGAIYGPKRRGFLDKNRIETRKSRVEYQLQECAAEMNTLDGTVDGMEQVLAVFSALIEPPEPAEGEEAVEPIEVPDILREKLTEMHERAVKKRYQAEMQVQAVHGALQQLNQLIALVSEVEVEDGAEIDWLQEPHPKQVIVSANGFNALETDHIMATARQE